MPDSPAPMMSSPGPPAIFAWAIHLFTASGAVLAMLAYVAIEQERWRLALLWLMVALVVDGVDGSFARWARVKEQAPQIDGDSLDLIVDFLNYVFIPTIFIWRAGLIPNATAPWLAAGILISSLYLFSRTDMKTEDGYFRGFPALWNLVAFYLFVIQAAHGLGAAIVCSLIVLTFAPIHFVHPFRITRYGRWLPGLAILWALATCALIIPNWSATAWVALLGVSLGTGAILIGLGLRRSFAGTAAFG